MPNSLYRMPLVYLFLTCVFCYSCSFLFVVFCVFVFFFCSHWSLVDVPLNFFCPADHVPDWQPRVLLGMVEARSVNVKKTTTTTGANQDSELEHVQTKLDTEFHQSAPCYYSHDHRALKPKYSPLDQNILRYLKHVFYQNTSHSNGKSFADKKKESFPSGNILRTNTHTPPGSV